MNCYSQNSVLIDSLPKSKYKISNEDIQSWTRNNNGVIFFCTKDYKDDSYLKQSQLFEISKLDSLKQIQINYITYEEFDNNSKNPYLINSGIKDSIINQIECFIVCEDSSNLNRAIKMYSPNFFILNCNKNKNIYQLSFKGICPKDLTYSISLYYDLIYEIFNPQYTTEEKLVKQEKTIVELKNELETLKKQQIEFEKNYSKEKEEFLNRISQLETSIKKKK